MVGAAHPALKRGANHHCAYGAGDRLLFGELDFIWRTGLKELVCWQAGGWEPI